MSANDGCPAVKATREAVDRPDIPRGSFTIPLPGSCMATDVVSKVSFVSHSLVPGYRLAYYDADVISVREGRAIVFVGPHDVVTWERL